MLSLSGLEIVFPDNSRGSLLGELDVATGKIRQGRLQVDGMLGRKFLPADYSFDRAGLDMTFSGALGDLSHSGQLTIQNLFSPELRPLQVQANWAGQGKGVSHSDVVVLAGKSSLRAAFALATTNHQINFLLQTLTLEHDSQPVMALEAPAEVLLREDRSTTRATIWTAKIQPLKWHGHNRQLDLEGELAWPLRGHVSGSARSLDFSLFEDFSKHRPGEIKVETLKFTSDWDEGPANISLDAAIFMITKGVSFSAQASLKGNSQGISLEGISIFTEAQPVFSAHGFLPLTLTPSQSTHRLNLLSDRPLQIDLLTKTNSLFWDEIAVSTGLVLVEPDMNMNLSGIWQLPKGHLDMKVKQIKLPAGLLTSVSTLMLEKLQLAVDLEQKQARIRDLNLLVEGQPLSLTADMPLGKSFWESLAAGKPNLDWENIRAELKTEHAQLAAFTRLLPKVLAPQGTMDLNVRLERGARVNGELTISGAATRSLGNFGAIRDIDVSMAFHESTLELKSVTAHLGGSPLSASGTVDLQGKDWLQGVPPPFQVKANGKNLPLARNPDCIIRGDIDVMISKGPLAPPLIVGSVRLHDSFYLQDLKELIPGRVASPSSRPPYFSIETQPLSDWRLNLSLKGDRFIKVNSPLFRGVISADLKLTGTLKEPIALGNAKIDSGMVQFPFANLEVTQGFVTLSSENPYRPQLRVGASSRRASYDVKMEVSGPADQPVVQFSSTPPLGSEQIVLMLTAGELPRTEYTLSAYQRAQSVAMYLGKNLLSKFGVSQDSDRLSIQSGENITETGSLTYRVEYKLTNRWYLVGEYDRFSALNLGLKWKIYSK